MYKCEHFQFSISDPEETDLTLVSVFDERTGFTVRTALPLNGTQTASIMAFAGARFSRSALGAEDIFREIKEAGGNAQEKLANIFNNYGHSSVGDMAQIFTYIEQIPDNYHVEFFYDTRVGAGQARSTRYQDFSNSYPPKFSTYVEDGKDYPELENEYNEIFRSTIGAYQIFLKRVKEEYKKFYQPKKGNKREAGALGSRSLDTARVLLPQGVNTSLAYITSAREWARLISVMKSDNRKKVQYLGEQLETLFAPPQDVMWALKYTPEAPDLIRHTEADTNLCNCVSEIGKMFKKELEFRHTNNFNKEFNQEVEILSSKLKPSEIVLYQVLLTIRPDLTASRFKKILRTLDDKKKEKIGKILYDRFNHHSQLGRQAEGSSYAFRISATFSELKDLNRHRAWARFAPVWETDDMESILKSGYVLPLYLHAKEFSGLKNEAKEQLEILYNKIQKFYNKLPEGINKRIILNLLPQAHRVEYYMHASPKEISYLAKLRIRPGGHINYRMLAYMIAEAVKDFDPLLSGLAFAKNQKPDPRSKEEFFDRS